VSWFFYGFAVNRWLGVRLELIGACVICLSAVLAVVLRSTLTAGLVGLAVTSSLALSGNLNWMVRQFSELEVQMNAVERIREYGTTPSEAPLVIDDYRPPSAWPHRGHIVIRDLVLKYRPDLPPILRGLTATISPGEKIGIVGRT
jgi:ATP-binding cassette subfamily C (CFTR/MRP) protein 1